MEYCSVRGRSARKKEDRFPPGTDPACYGVDGNPPCENCPPELKTGFAALFNELYAPMAHARDANGAFPWAAFIDRIDREDCDGQTKCLLIDAATAIEGVINERRAEQFEESRAEMERKSKTKHR